MRVLDPLRLVKAAFGLIAIVLLACSSSPPPPVEASPKPKPEKAPPPPPKCQAMKDACKADKSTRVPIPGTDLQFQPPKGWHYAKLGEASVAQVGEKGAVLVLTTFEPGKPQQQKKQRGELATSLAELVAIEPKGTISLQKPNTTSEIAGLEMSLWERPGAKRADDDGALLVLSAEDGKRELFGIGFAPVDDADGTKAILDTLNTLERGDETAPIPDDGK